MPKNGITNGLHRFWMRKLAKYGYTLAMVNGNSVQRTIRGRSMPKENIRVVNKSSGSIRKESNTTEKYYAE